jgi:hypothetical protein
MSKAFKQLLQPLQLMKEFKHQIQYKIVKTSHLLHKLKLITIKFQTTEVMFRVFKQLMEEIKDLALEVMYKIVKISHLLYKLKIITIRFQIMEVMFRVFKQFLQSLLLMEEIKHLTLKVMYKIQNISSSSQYQNNNDILSNNGGYVQNVQPTSAVTPTYV